MQTSLWWNWPVNKQFDHSRANGCHKAPGHPKHFRLDCLIFQCVKCLFATKQAVFMEAVPVLTPYCSQSLKVTVNQTCMYLGEAIYGEPSIKTVYRTRTSNGKHGNNLGVS